MFTQHQQIDGENNWPQPPSFDRNAPIQYPRKFEPSYLSYVHIYIYLNKTHNCNMSYI